MEAKNVVMKTQQYKMISDDLNPEFVTAEVIETINHWFREENIVQNDVQKAMLLSHVKAMVMRAKTLEPLPDVDPTMFDEISSASIDLARKTVALFDTLPMEEAYLLSVHYEVARANQE